MVEPVPEPVSKDGHRIEKTLLGAQLHQGGNPFFRYKNKVLGSDKGYLHLLQFELSQICFANLGGGAGYLARRLSLSSLFRECGSGLILGRGIILRRLAAISLGKNVAIDDHTLIDGGMESACRIDIGAGVIISKGSVIQAKNGPLEIGDECDIGAHTIISSAGGIFLAPNVLIAGNCYIGGARYNLDALDTPIMYQGVYSRGPIRVGEGTWIGASVNILDGVTIGKGCVVGAGSTVLKDIPDYSIAVGSPATVIKNRRH